MKIAIDARFFGTETGIGRYVKELVENLEKIDAENQYVIFLSAKNFDLYRPQNTNFQKKLADIKWYSLKEQLRMGRLVDAEHADLAHFPHFNVPFFCRTPYIVTIHDLILRHYPTSSASTKNSAIFYLKYFFYNLVLRRAIKKARKIIVPSYFVKNDLIKNFGGLDSRLPTSLKLRGAGRGNDRGRGGNDRGRGGNDRWGSGDDREGDGDGKRENLADKIRVIYEGLSNLPSVDLSEEYLETKNITSPYLLYIGNCYPHKNLEKLIEAFEILNKIPLPTSPFMKGGGGGGLQLVLAGKRDYFSKKLEEEITKRYALIANRCIFYGYASDEELSTLYKHASLYVFPSLMEGFGLPPLEALSFGLPSAVSDISVFHEILGNAAFYFNPNDAADMARVMKSVLQDAGARSKILEEGGRVLLRYNWKKNAGETMEIYHSSMKRKNGGAPCGK